MWGGGGGGVGFLFFVLFGFFVVVMFFVVVFFSVDNLFFFILTTAEPWVKNWNQQIDLNTPILANKKRPADTACVHVGVCVVIRSNTVAYSQTGACSV